MTDAATLRALADRVESLVELPSDAMNNAVSDALGEGCGEALLYGSLDACAALRKTVLTRRYDIGMDYDAVTGAWCVVYCEPGTIRGMSEGLHAELARADLVAILRARAAEMEAGDAQP